MSDMVKGRSALIDGDIKNGPIWCGQDAGMIKEMKKVKDVVDEIVREGKKMMDDFSTTLNR